MAREHQSRELISPYEPIPGEELEHLSLRMEGGISISSEVCNRFLDENNLRAQVAEHYNAVDPANPNSSMIQGFRLRKLLQEQPLPESLLTSLEEGCRGMGQDLESTDFRLFHQGRSPLDAPSRVRGLTALKQRLQKTYVEHICNGIIHKAEYPEYHFLQDVPELVVQRSELTISSGVALTLEPRSKSTDFLVVYSVWGLAEDIVRKTVARDEYWFHKNMVREGKTEPLYRRAGHKEFQLHYDSESDRLEHLTLGREKSRRYSLDTEEAHQLARDTLRLCSEGRNLEITWQKNEEGLVILGVRPFEVESTPVLKLFRRDGDGEVLLTGRAVTNSVATGRVRVLESGEQLHEFQEGEILVASRTQPDWEPAFKKASALVTALDRRASHSTILAREMGIPALLDAEGCNRKLQTGDEVTVSCCEGEVGRVFRGKVSHTVEEFNLHNPPDLGVQVMVNLSMPERALSTARLPWSGAGLVRSEFMIGGWVKIHPLALLNPHKLTQETQTAVARIAGTSNPGEEFFIEKMSQAVGIMAGAFWPRPVTLRLSDFKSDEYARLLGGEIFEPQEDHSNLGWRGAARYIHPNYKDAFLLELAACRRVREEFGFTNLHLMVPFCRTPEEGVEVLALMKEFGLEQGKDGLEVWVMAELPSNVFLIDQFAELFDGLSIGSSDLTSLTLGVDRNSKHLSSYFDELHPAMMNAYERIIAGAHSAHRKVSFCGQAASEDTEFAALLVEMGVDALSLAPDALPATLQRLKVGH